MKAQSFPFDYISVLKRHYIVMIILPIYCVLSWILIGALHEDHKYPTFNQVMACIDIGLFLLFIFLPVFYFIKGKYMMAFYIFLTPMIIIIATSKVVGSYGFDSDGIFFLFHKEEYLGIIESSSSMATDGGAKLVKIKMESVWFACDRYLIYDESDEISNNRGKFRGINYMYMTDMNGNKYKYESNNVVAKKYAKHIYIVDVCPNTDQ